MALRVPAVQNRPNAPGPGIPSTISSMLARLDRELIGVFAVSEQIYECEVEKQVMSVVPSRLNGGMNELLEGLRSLRDQAVEVSRGIDAVGALADADLVEMLTVAGHVQRLLDAVVVEAVGEVEARSDSTVTQERMTARLGCRDVPELVERTTRCSRSTADRYRRAAKAIRRETSIVTGEILPSPLPATREALLGGELGLDGLLAVAGPLQGMGGRAEHELLMLADAALAAQAKGEGPDAAPPAPADVLRMHAQAWAAVLDEDGAEPREREVIRHRGITLSGPTDHGVPLRGMLMPEVAAQLQRIFDALGAPGAAAGGVQFTDPDSTLEDDVPLDTRTAAQKRHDALANALAVAAVSGELPTIGGAAPTLIVSVNAEDLAAGTGSAHLEGCEAPVSLATAHRVACAGSTQRVLIAEGGRIVALGVPDRVFNAHQRRAITLRDGGCIIPGCQIPASWCEIHHVTDHAKGGPTHTDNGALLCWYHHRFLEWNGWHIRMNNGVPEVRAPAWYDATLRWRPVTRSGTRLARAVRRGEVPPAPS